MKISEVLLFLVILGPLVFWFAKSVWRGYQGGSSRQEKPLPNLPIGEHPLGKGQIRKPIKITISREAWQWIDQLMEQQEKHSPGISPVIYGYLLVAGIVRFRQTVRITGSSFETFITLLKDLTSYELSSPFYVFFRVYRS